MVHSRTTEKYIKEWKYDKTVLVLHHPIAETLKKADTESQVIAIGGGSVIDTAKIISRNPVIAVPTTLAGASRTSHAVYWDKNRKKSASTAHPITILKPQYLQTLPQNLLDYSKADCICHALESLISVNANEQSKLYASMALELIKKETREDTLIASLLAGDAIEITGTNLIHALSYPLTALYNIPHGKALSFLLPKILPYLEHLIQIDIPIPTTPIDIEADMQRVINEAFTYSKIFKTRTPINKKVLTALLGGKQ